MINVYELAFSQKLLKTDVLKLKLLEDLIFCPMIKFGVNREKYYRKKIGKYVSRYIFSQEINFKK